MALNEKKKHTKHTSLTKPLGGEYHRNEWAIVGASSNSIKDFATALNKELSQQLKIGYLDQDNSVPIKADEFYINYCDKNNYHSYNSNLKPNQKQFRKFFNDLDVLLINGNHFVGTKQILFNNNANKELLRTKIGTLSDIKIVITNNETLDDEINKLISGKDDVLICKKEDLNIIANHILSDYEMSKPPLFGLVLAGGKSQRMGKDKGSIIYHDKPQREYQADILSSVCHQTFISCRDQQSNTIESQYEKLVDSFQELGPYGGLLSAFRKHPNCAWLTVACDLPYMNSETINHLKNERDQSKLATCFHNPETDFPEPLITIWEPRAYPILLEFLSQGYSCLRKVLINSDIKEITMDNIICMTNANDPEAYQSARDSINKIS